MSVGDLWTLFIVASSEETPPDILRQLAKHEHYLIRLNVAHNPSAPPDVLDLLSCEGDYYIRCAIARNRSSPPRVLERLYRQALKCHDLLERETILVVLALNESCPEDILFALSLEGGDVGEAARENLKNRKEVDSHACQ